LGKEEDDIIRPALSAASHAGAEIEGPFASDAYFGNKAYKRYDATICLYHDQGLIPFKMLSFHDGVNLTLGLPYVRTSPDHGPAFDIAGQGTAHPGSFSAAIQLIETLTK
jgi:4-hydroxythreonine-4-phosphate dehydrogenase